MLSATADASLGCSDSYPHYQLFRRAQRLGLKIMRHVPYSIESVLDSDSLVYRVELSRLVVPQKQNTQPAGFVSHPISVLATHEQQPGLTHSASEQQQSSSFPVVWGICWYSFVPEKRGFRGLFREGGGLSLFWLPREGRVESVSVTKFLIRRALHRRLCSDP
jgi:hypothetical protein